MTMTVIMKTLRLFVSGALLCGAMLALNPAFGQGTAFTYQGRLTVSTNEANGSYDFTFKLFNAASGGSQTGGTITYTAVGVTNGLFVVPLDFGAVYDTTPYWLELAVRTNGAASFTTVAPRQELTPTPYAITAENVSGSVSASQITSPLVGATASPLFEVDQGGTGAGLVGSHTAATGTSAGVQGVTASTDSSAMAIYGLVSSTSPGCFSTAVLGQNNGTGGCGIGVEGSQNGSGWGVWGTTASGWGVYGSGGSGTGVYADGGTGVSGNGSTGDGVDGVASSAAGIGVYGTHSAVTGTAAGVEGDTDSTNDYANGVYGVVESQTPGFAAGVRGQNNGTNGSGVGVWGSQAGSGIGVYGTATSGIGVYASGGTGFGLEAVGGTGLYALGDTGDGIDSYADDDSGIGVYGIHDSLTGTAAGVEGDTYSTNDYAFAVYGVVTSTTPGFDSTALRGQNNDTNGAGVGVWGSQNGSGIGIYGYTPSGIGVYGNTSSGTAVYASSSSGSALTVGSGAIHVSGAGVGTGTAAFIQLATTNNSYGSPAAYITIISNPLCDGDPNAILIATHQWSPPGVPGNYETHPYSVWYDGSNWTIYNDDLTDITGMSFNVLVIKN